MGDRGQVSQTGWESQLLWAGPDCDTQLQNEIENNITHLKLGVGGTSFHVILN